MKNTVYRSCVFGRRGTSLERTHVNYMTNSVRWGDKDLELKELQVAGTGKLLFQRLRSVQDGDVPHPNMYSFEVLRRSSVQMTVCLATKSEKNLDFCPPLLHAT